MSVEFDPVRLGQRRRRLEPAVVGVVVVTVAIVIAIAKPWDRGAPSSSPAASAVAIAEIDPSPTEALVASPTPTSSPMPSPPDWSAVVGVVTGHEAWGVSAVLAATPGPGGAPVSPPAERYLERWTQTTDGFDGADLAYVDREERSVVALGVTVPDEVRARSVRIWRLHNDNALEWIDAARIDGGAPGATPLLVPLAEQETAWQWDAGQYRVDVLTEGGIHRISVFIPNESGDVPRPTPWTSQPQRIVPAEFSDPSGIQRGLFATVDGAGVSIPAREAEPLEEAQAWHDVAVADGATVASTYLPRATGLGVMLTNRAAVESASIRRLSPDGLPNPPEAFGGISNMRGRTPFVVFPEPSGGVWTPGVYAITVDWKDVGGGTHHGTWHVELRPGID